MQLRGGFICHGSVYGPTDNPTIGNPPQIQISHHHEHTMLLSAVGSVLVYTGICFCFETKYKAMDQAERLLCTQLNGGILFDAGQKPPHAKGGGRLKRLRGLEELHKTVPGCFP